ncbi:hypothetical protein OG871_37930 [Kitasatospora sp. NBC_00374]|uniref:hypothetical protein n=1 Tax=Kitasatospora sp. NBC_00374 TaxID=2975964 RepID=UPI0030E17D8F
MAVIVLLELLEPLDARVISVGEEPVDELAVRLVHAAPSDPDVPGDPGPLTACGLDTTGMLTEHWRPAGPGAGWYPPRWEGHICEQCAAAVRSAG